MAASAWPMLDAGFQPPHDGKQQGPPLVTESGKRVDPLDTS